MSTIFPCEAMLMAAGLGTRLKPFTDDLTKALIPIFDIPVIQFGIDNLAQAGVKSFVANIHHHAESTRQKMSQLDLCGGQLVLSDESSQLLGSAGGIRQASQYIENSSFFLSNADVISDVDLKSLANQHLKLRSKWGVSITLALFRSGPPGFSYREIFCDSSGLISGLGELKEERPFFIGAAVVEKEALGDIPPSGPAEFLPTILEPAIRAKKAGYFLTSGNWYDVGTPRLWLDTHLAFLDRLETGNFKNSRLRKWQARIEKVNRRIGDRIWVSARTPKIVQSVEWAAPCYWSSSLNKSPIGLGPQAILYGDPQNPVCQNGIGMNGKWVQL